MYRVLVASDLHIGDKAHCATMMPHPGVSHENLGLLDGFNKLVKSIDLPIDAIFFPGDLTNASQPSEVTKFDSVANQITSLCGLKLERVYATFGNHDSDWIVQKNASPAEDRKIYFDRRYDNIKNSKVLKKILSRAKGDLYSDMYALWDDEILVLTINTAHSERFDDPIKHGQVARDVLDAIRTKHSSTLESRDKFKILMIHHHPLLYSNLVKLWKDYSAIQEAEVLLGFADEFGFDLVIHGHRHAPDYKAYLSQTAKQTICFCCGSFSARLSPALMGSVSNQVHLLELEGRDSTTGVVRGSVRSWSFSGAGGWRKSESNDGLEHEIRFGPLHHENAILDILRSKIGSKISARGFVTVKELLAESEVVRYTRDRVLMKLVSEVASELGLDVRGTLPEEAVILGGSA